MPLRSTRTAPTPIRKPYATLSTPFHSFHSKASPYTTPFYTLLQPLLNHHHQHNLLYYAPIFQYLTAHTHLKLGHQVHAHLLLRGVEVNAFLGSKMVAMYASSSDLDAAENVFSIIENPSCLLFNSIIRACTKHGFPFKSLELYSQMHCLGFKGDYFTFPFVLKSCAELLLVSVGRCVHGQSVRLGLVLDIYVGTSLIDMYVKCGGLSDAAQLFDEMTVRDVSSWNVLIAGYMKDGRVTDAERLFWRMPCRNIVSWTAMISGYTQNAFPERALHMFDEMLLDDSEVKPNWVTVVSVLPACAHAAALERGIQIHDYATRMGWDSYSSVQTALIAMYAKCGSLVDACKCFDRMGDKNLVAWNTMITAYSSHGRGMEAVATFEEMIRAGFKPDSISFTGLLSGCSHSGLVDTGMKYFDCMKREFPVEYQHYACVVDLMSRSGRLLEAKEIIDHMPMEAGASIWGALLAACRKYKNFEIAEIAAKKLFVLEPENIGNYVLLSNTYADVGMWDKVDNLRAFVKCQGIRKKDPGCSWIEINGKCYLFLGGDISHPQSKEIYAFLDSLPEKIKSTGYVPDTTSVLHDIAEEEKEHNLLSHSEKMAIAFGLLNTNDGVILRVTKNLRICGDCHTVMKFISVVYQREIIVRDLYRFHHFKDGTCSCRDYW